MALPLLIIVSGAPGAGKTTLARRIAREFRLPLTAKDDIKETLFDALGRQDREWSRRLGLATYDLMYYFVAAQLAAGQSLIVESNFRGELATAQFRALQARHAFTPFQILLRADLATLSARFRTRGTSGARHPGHVDHLASAAELAATLAGPFTTLDLGGQVIEIDTTDFARVDYTALFEMLAATLNAPACAEMR